jgi:hypothetical protein
MNKRQIIASLNKIANELDTAKFYTEANTVTKVMSKIAMDGNDEYGSMEDMGYCPECEEFTLIDGKCEQCGHNEDEDYPNRNITHGLDEISSMMDMHGNHPADKLREDYSGDYNNPTFPEMKNVFRDLDELVVENMTMNREQRKRYEEIKKQIMNAF